MTQQDKKQMWDGVFAKIDNIKKHSSNPQKIEDFENGLIDTIKTDWQFDTAKQRQQFANSMSVIKARILSFDLENDYKRLTDALDKLSQNVENIRGYRDFIIYESAIHDIENDIGQIHLHMEMWKEMLKEARDYGKENSDGNRERRRNDNHRHHSK